jgi:hypothetical protein
MSLANVSLGMPLTILCGETVSYNALVLLSFVLSGFGAYLLAFRLTGERLAGLLSGVVYGFCCYRMAHLGAGHLNLLGSQWVPFLFLYLEELLEAERALPAVLAGVFFALSALSSWYYAPMLAIFAAVYLLSRGRPWQERIQDRQLWQRFAVVAMVAGLLMAPSIVHTAQQWSQRQMAFSLREVDIFSASIGDFFVPNPMHPFWGSRVASYYLERQDVPEHMIVLSWVAMVLAAVALWPRLRGDVTQPRPEDGGTRPSSKDSGPRPRSKDSGTQPRPKDGGTWSDRQRMPSVYALLLVLSLVLALGTTLHIGGQRVYIAVPTWIEKGFTAVMGLLANRLALHPMPTYYDLRLVGVIYVPLPTLLGYLYAPFFDAMRVWTRFGLIGTFAVAVLAGIGVARVIRGVRRAQSPRRSALLGWLCVALVAFELMAVPYPLGWSRVQSQPVDKWLAQQTEGGAVIQLPLSKAESGPGLYATTVHGRPIAYGYGAFFPSRYRQRRPVLWDFPTVQAIALLREWGVGYVLVGAESYGAQWPNVQRRIDQFEALRLVAMFAEEPVYHSGWLAESLPDFARTFQVDRIYVYRLV